MNHEQPWAVVRLLSAVLAVSAIAISATFAASVSYTYDELGRLKTATYDDGTVTTYTLDAAGNRTNVTTSPAPPSGPSVPANLRTSPVGSSTTGNYTVLWNASSGTVHHYTLHQVRVFPTPTTQTDYSITPPAVSKNFTNGGPEKEFEYTVRACASAGESQCSAWSNAASINVCSGASCNNLTGETE